MVAHVRGAQRRAARLVHSTSPGLFALDAHERVSADESTHSPQIPPRRRPCGTESLPAGPGCHCPGVVVVGVEEGAALGLGHGFRGLLLFSHAVVGCRTQSGSWRWRRRGRRRGRRRRGRRRGTRAAPAAVARGGALGRGAPADVARGEVAAPLAADVHVVERLVGRRLRAWRYVVPVVPRRCRCRCTRRRGRSSRRSGSRRW